MNQKIVPFLCVLPECTHRRGIGNHWFLSYINPNRQLIFSKWDDEQALRPGIGHICGEACMQKLLSRWASGKITALDRPECASRAVLTDSTLTAWVSSIFQQGSFQNPRRIVNYKDSGRDCSVVCFRRGVFGKVERTAGHYATFQVEKSGKFVNVIDVLKIEGQPCHSSQ